MIITIGTGYVLFDNMKVYTGQLCDTNRIDDNNVAFNLNRDATQMQPNFIAVKFSDVNSIAGVKNIDDLINLVADTLNNNILEEPTFTINDTTAFTGKHARAFVATSDTVFTSLYADNDQNTPLLPLLASTPANGFKNGFYYKANGYKIGGGQLTSGTINLIG